MRTETITNHNIHCLNPLSEKAKSEGIDIVKRLLEDWESGINRFSKPGELLLGAFTDQKCIGVCGLNIDPYANDKSIGRIRRLYVSPGYRRKGVASQLLRRIIEKCNDRFRVLRLYTNNPEAALFYKRMGFEDFREEQGSHRLIL